MTTLDKVQDRMTALGWSDGGGPGSKKANGDEHGSPAYMSDLALACEQVEREAIIAELQRRAQEAA